MEQKNIGNIILGGLIGLLIGFLIWGSFGNQSSYGCKMMSGTGGGTHIMPDGTTMKNVEMTMENMMAEMNYSLSKKAGNDFDRAFLQEMIIHHQGAVDMAKMVLDRSNRQELRKLAEEIISAQNNEIDMMKNWQKSW